MKVNKFIDTLKVISTTDISTPSVVSMMARPFSLNVSVDFCISFSLIFVHLLFLILNTMPGTKQY